MSFRFSNRGSPGPLCRNGVARLFHRRRIFRHPLASHTDGFWRAAEWSNGNAAAKSSSAFHLPADIAVGSAASFGVRPLHSQTATRLDPTGGRRARAGNTFMNATDLPAEIAQRWPGKTQCQSPKSFGPGSNLRAGCAAGGKRLVVPRSWLQPRRIDRRRRRHRVAVRYVFYGQTGARLGAPAGDLSARSEKLSQHQPLRACGGLA